MAIITVSRGSYSRGKEIAEKVAEELGYECVSRDILLAASETFNIPEVKLVRALHDAPSVLERFTYGRNKYLAYITQAFLERVQKDNVIYHGLAGYCFLKGVGHALKVRIIADLDDRARQEMKREKCTEDEARSLLQKDDDERRRWALALYGIDTSDPMQYDLVVHIRKFSVKDAVDMICRAAVLPQFQVTPESQKALDDLVLAARVRSEVISVCPNAIVFADGGAVTVYVEAAKLGHSKMCEQTRAIAKAVPGVKEVRVSSHS